MWSLRLEEKHKLPLRPEPGLLRFCERWACYREYSSLPPNLRLRLDAGLPALPRDRASNLRMRLMMLFTRRWTLAVRENARAG